jgi:hypothetical protein
VPASAHCLESTPLSHSQCPSSQINGAGAALAHDATHVNAVIGVQSPSTSPRASRALPLESVAPHEVAVVQAPPASTMTSRAPPLESAGRSAATSAASGRTDEELELQPTRKATTKITRPVLTIFRR